jgi:hypothetical protein
MVGIFRLELRANDTQEKTQTETASVRADTSVKANRNLETSSVQVSIPTLKFQQNSASETQLVSALAQPQRDEALSKTKACQDCSLVTLQRVIEVPKAVSMLSGTETAKQSMEVQPVNSSRSASLVIPDLVADRVYLRTGPNSGPEVDSTVAGHLYYVHFDWRNTGTTTASNFRLEIRLNGSVRCFTNTVSANANTGYIVRCSAALIWPSGSNIIQGVLDVNNVIAESNEDNNSVSRTYRAQDNGGDLPDLVAERVYLRTGPISGSEVDFPVAGQQYYIHFDWRNTSATTTDTFRHQVKLNGIIVVAGSSRTPGYSKNTSYNVNGFRWPGGTGTRTDTLQAVLDVNNFVAESNERNNSVSRIYRTSGSGGGDLPDLVAERVYLRTGPNSGSEVINPVANQQYYVHFVYRNAGFTAANKFRLEVRVNGNVLCDNSATEVNARSSSLTWCSTAIVWPGPGNTIIEGVLDVNNVIVEWDESNNNVVMNNPPQLAGNGVPNQKLIFAGRFFTQALYEIFIDADGDLLNFKVNCSNRSVALAVVESDTLTIVPVSTGNAQIAVAANDGKGGEVTISFGVTVELSQPPQIAHNPLVSPRLLSLPIDITATITDDEDTMPAATLKYRLGGTPNFFAPVMDALGRREHTFGATIPGLHVTERGLEYYIEARDQYGIAAREPESGFYSVRVRIEGKGVTNTRPEPSGDAPTSYHLFSVPLDLDNKRAEAVLVDNLGPPNIKKWRFFDLITDTTTGVVNQVEFPNTVDMAPGKAFWLIVKSPNQFIDTGPGTTVSTAAPFPIRLNKGWNLVGNPFNFETFANDSLSNGERLVFFAYEGGGWSDTLYTTERELRPFEGYAVFSATACSMFVNPNRFSSPGSLAKTETATENEMLWTIRIRAQCQEARDGNNVAAVVKQASREYDRIDQPEPPVIGEYVSVYFPHREWNTLAKTYCLDARPEPIEGEVWDFEVKTNIRDKVNLTFEGIDEVPKEFEVWLVDDALKITKNLREQGQYAVAGAGPVAVAGAVAGAEHVKQLKLVVGNREFVDEKLAEARAIPTTYELSQNFPNPFNPATTIRYGLPSAERVTLKIYNLLGAEVATLVNDEPKAAGYHAAIWDGRDKNGRVVASGVYVYRMQAGSFVMTKKLALVK